MTPSMVYLWRLIPDPWKRSKRWKNSSVSWADRFSDSDSLNSITRGFRPTKKSTQRIRVCRGAVNNTEHPDTSFAIIL
jgi:hypothetical protein